MSEQEITNEFQSITRSINTSDSVAKIGGETAKVAAIDAGAEAAVARAATPPGALEGKYAALNGLSAVDVPLLPGMMPSSGQVAKENLRGVNALLDRLEAGVKANWGRGVAAGDFTPEQVVALREWSAETKGRVAKAKAIAAAYATKKRDFALLNYGQKTGLDHALAYIFPYQFWYSRSYANWMRRLAANPVVLTAYAHYRHWLEQEHSKLPDWWKYNVNFSDLPGVDTNRLKNNKSPLGD